MYKHIHKYLQFQIRRGQFFKSMEIPTETKIAKMTSERQTSCKLSLHKVENFSCRKYCPKSEDIIPGTPVFKIHVEVGDRLQEAVGLGFETGHSNRFELDLKSILGSRFDWFISN